MPKIVRLPDGYLHICTEILNAYVSSMGIPRREGLVLGCDCGDEFELIVHPMSVKYGIGLSEAARIWQRYEPPF